MSSVSAPWSCGSAFGSGWENKIGGSAEDCQAQCEKFLINQLVGDFAN